MNKLHADLENCKKSLSDFRETKDELNEKIQDLKGANEAEMLKG